MIGVDDFAVRRRHRYATIIIDAETGERANVLPDHEAATLEVWLRGQKSSDPSKRSVPKAERHRCRSSAAPLTYVPFRCDCYDRARARCQAGRGVGG